MPRLPLHRCSLCAFLAVIVVNPVSRAQTPAPFSLAAPSPKQTTEPARPDFTEAADGYVPAKPIHQPPVAYPELAHLNRAEGVVRMVLSIDEGGNLSNARVSRSSGSIMLDTAVRDYHLQQWKFQPATLNGKPVPSAKIQEFEFRLDPVEERAIARKRLALPVGMPNAPYPTEAMPLKLRGIVTVGVWWTKAGLVDQIYVVKTSGYPFLDGKAARWAYENWHVDPATLVGKNQKEAFTKTMNFEPPP